MGQKRPKVVVVGSVRYGLSRPVRGRRPGVNLTLVKGCISICVLHRLHRFVRDRDKVQGLSGGFVVPCSNYKVLGAFPQVLIKGARARPSD